MKHRFNRFIGCVVFGALVGTAFGQTAFTYQGYLSEGGAAARGTFDLRFTLFDAPAGGEQVGAAQTNAAVVVSNGLFTVSLDFGTNAFNGEARWLEIGVRPAGATADFTPLAPRQSVGAAPYALHSLKAATLSAPLAPALLPGNAARLDADQTFTGRIHFGATGAAPFSVSSTGRVEGLNAALLEGLPSSDFARADHTHAARNIYYVAPGGSDTNTGTLDRPFATLGGAISNVPDHSLLILAPGEYAVTPVHVTDYFDSRAPVRIVGRTNLTIQGYGATLNGGTNGGRFVFVAQSSRITFAGVTFINDVHPPLAPGELLFSTIDLAGTNSVLRFLDCGFDQFGNHAISQLYWADGTKASDGVWVERCWFANGGSDAAQDGTAISGLGRNWFVRGCLFTNCYRDVEMEGPAYHGDGGQIHIEGCTSVSNRDIAIMLFCTSGNMANHPHVHVAHNVIRGAFNVGVALRGGRNLQVVNNTIEMAGPESLGIALWDECAVDGALIQNNLVRGAGWRGIQAWGARLTNVVIANNLIRECSHYGIWAAAQRLRIAGNSLETGSDIKWGIRVDGSPDAVIENNTIHARTADARGIYLDGTVTNASVLNNHFVGGLSPILNEGHIRAYSEPGTLGTATQPWTIYGTNALGASNSAFPLLSNILYVAINGSDADGVPGRMDRPYATLQGAIAAAPNGSFIQVAPGLYRVVPHPEATLAPIQIQDKVNLTIFAPGAVLDGGTNGGGFIRIRNCDHVSIQGLTLRNDQRLSLTNAGVFYASICLSGTNSNLRFVDCEFVNFGDHGISQIDPLSPAKATDGVWVERCSFLNGGGNWAFVDGAAISGLGRDWFVTGCLFSNVFRGVEMEGAAYHQDGGQVLIAHNTFVDVEGLGVMSFCTSPKPSNYLCISVLGNIFRRCQTTAIDLDCGINLTVADNLVECIDGPADGGYGIMVGSLLPVNNLLIANNQVYGAEWRGIQVFGPAITNVVIRGNLVADCGHNAIECAAQKLTISGNQIWTGRGIKWGMIISGAVAPVIENNTLYATTPDARGIYLGDGVTNAVLFNNRFTGGWSLLGGPGHVASVLVPNQLGSAAIPWTVFGKDSFLAGSNYIETLSVGTLHSTNAATLPANVARLDADQTFTRANHFAAPSNRFGGDLRVDGTISSGLPSAFVVNPASARAVDAGVSVVLRANHYGSVTIYSTNGGTYRVVVPFDLPVQMYGRRPAAWSVTTHLSDCSTNNFVSRTRIYNSAVQESAGTYTEDATPRSATGLQTYTVTGPAGFEDTSRPRAVEYQVTLAPNGSISLGSVMVSYTY